jgi:hypothetical protein
MIGFSTDPGMTKKPLGVCVVCAKALPPPKDPLKGGRPRKTCSRRCKYRLDRRMRTLARMERFRIAAEKRAQFWERRARGFAAMPFTVGRQGTSDVAN